MTTEHSQKDAQKENSPSDNLTKRQSEVLDVIREHIDKQGAPPTRAEIAKKLGFRSVNAAEDHLKALARKGAIALFPGTSRGIQLVGSNAPGLEILRCTAGHLSLFHPDNIAGRSKAPSELFEPQAHFFLEIEAAFAQNGFEIGDLVAIHQQKEARHGQFILARVNNLWQFGLYSQHEDHIAFGGNGAKEPAMRFATGYESNIDIEGIAVGLIRKY